MIKKSIIAVFLTLVTVVRANGGIIAVDRRGGSGHSTIQAAIDAAMPGDTVVIADGLYKENLILKGGITLRGRGSGLVRIEGDGDRPVIYGQGVEDISLSGLSISSGRNKNIPLILLTSSKVSISNTLLYGSPLSAVEAKNGSEVKIKDSLIKGNRGSGLLSSGSKISVEKSFIAGNGFFGIEVREKGEASIKDSYINENQTGGVLVKGGGKISLQNNLIIGNIFNGIWVKDAACQASNNTIAGNAKAGIFLEPTAKGEINNNILYGNGTGIKRNENQNKIGITTTNNLFWGNVENYSGLSKRAGDLVANPLFDTNYNLGDKSPALKGEKRIGALPSPLLFAKLEEKPAGVATQDDKGLYQTHYEAGMTHENKGEYDEAIVEFNRSAELKNDYSLPYYQLGKIYHGTGKLELAKEAYAKAVSLEPDNPDFHLALGETYWSLKEYFLAQEQIKKAMAMNSKDGKGEKMLEKIETELGKNSDNQEQK